MNLTTIAALPGSGAGHVAALRREVGRAAPTPQETAERMECVQRQLAAAQGVCASPFPCHCLGCMNRAKVAASKWRAGA